MPRRLHLELQRWSIAARRWSGLIGIAVALVATLGTWYQGALMREHNRLSVAPRLRLVPYLEGEGRRNGLYLENVGLGPAELVALRVTTTERTYDLMQPGSQRAVLQGLHADLRCFAETQPEPGVYVKAGSTEPLFVATAATAMPGCLWNVANTLMRHALEVEAEYRSMYLQSFTLRQRVRVDANAFTSRGVQAPAPVSRPSR